MGAKQFPWRDSGVAAILLRKASQRTRCPFAVDCIFTPMQLFHKLTPATRKAHGAPHCGFWFLQAKMPGAGQFRLSRLPADSISFAAQPRHPFHASPVQARSRRHAGCACATQHEPHSVPFPADSAKRASIRWQPAGFSEALALAGLRSRQPLVQLALRGRERARILNHQFNQQIARSAAEGKPLPAQAQLLP